MKLVILVLKVRFQEILTITSEDNSSTDTISWMVVGERQDPTIKESTITDDDGYLLVEEDKATE